MFSGLNSFDNANISANLNLDLDFELNKKTKEQKMQKPIRICWKLVNKYGSTEPKIYSSTLLMQSEKEEEYDDITRFIQNEVTFSNIKNGECKIYNPHTTFVVFVNEADPALLEDFRKFVNTITLINKYWSAPCKHGQRLRHDCKECGSTCNRQNGAAHLKTVFVNPAASLQINVQNGKMILGKWQSIIAAEYNGPRQKRELKIKIINDE